MTAKRKENVDRLLDPRWASARDVGWKLWDRDGRLWELHAESLDRERVSTLLHAPGVQVAIAQATRGLDWIEPEDRPTRWKQELESRCFDPAWTWEAKRSLPLSAKELASKGDRLLLFHDDD